MSISDLADNTAPLEDGTTGDAKGAGRDTPDADWLMLAKRSYDSSTQWIDTELRQQWERSIDHFHAKHPKGSKYNSAEFKHRSKLFRPKTRAQIRKSEAAAANAFFATVDVVNVEAEDDNDPMQAASAAINKELLNYRLRKTIPWFRVCMGAFQDASVLGICVSKQYWDKEKDAPCIELISPENLRIDGGADWVDPVNSSPYIIHLVPMYACDVKERMASGEWIELDDATLKKGTKTRSDDSVADARGRFVGDQNSTNEGVPDHEVIWCHENIIRYDGGEWVYWTLGTHALLSEPKPIEEVYLHGKRPFAIGYSVLEAHRPMPDGKAALASQLQMAANDIMNLRMDAVRLAMVGRMVVRSGVKELDGQNLTRFVPGAPIYTPNPESDVKWDRAPEVGMSAYEEQGRVDLDTDDLLGAFNGASVMANRQVGETVGGMQLLSGAQNALLEYDLRVFTETWVEPVLRQLMLLEQAYETNLTVLALAGQRAQLFQRFGVDAITDELLKQELTLSVNVGVGATDPTQQLQRFAMGFQTLIGIAGPIMQVAGPGFLKSEGFEQISAEIFGKLGYKDGKRFLNFEPREPMPQQAPPPDPRIIQAQMQAQLDAQKLQIEAQNKAQQASLEEQRLQLDREKAEAEIILKANELQGKFGIEAQKVAVQAGIEREKMAVSLQDSAAERELNARLKNEDRAHAIQSEERAAMREKPKAEPEPKPAPKQDDTPMAAALTAIAKALENTSRPRTVTRGPDGRVSGIE